MAAGESRVLLVKVLSSCFGAFSGLVVENTFNPFGKSKSL